MGTEIWDWRPVHELANTKVSDMLLSYFPLGHEGILLEVGAAHPESFSISFPFRDLGWSVISVEPIPEFCEEFRKRGFPVLEYAACSEDIGSTTFMVSPNLVCSSSLGIKHHDQILTAFGWTYESFETIDIQALTLDTILKTHYPQLDHVDVLIVDTEGWELEVMDGFDLARFNPKVVCLENLSTDERPVELYERYMEGHGYSLDMKELQDEIYIRGLR